MFLGKALLYGAHKTRGPAARSVVRVFTYYLPEISKTLAVMFSVPSDYSWYGHKWADEDLYKQMYYDDSFIGNDGWHPRNLGSGLKMKGAMSSSGQATIEIHILKQ